MDVIFWKRLKVYARPILVVGVLDFRLGSALSYRVDSFRIQYTLETVLELLHPTVSKIRYVGG